MGTTRKTITLTDKQDQWIKARITAGEYTNDSEYIRDLVRRDQEENAKFKALKQAIQEGLNSGVSNKSVTDIMEEVGARTEALRQALIEGEQSGESSPLDMEEIRREAREEAGLNA